MPDPSTNPYTRAMPQQPPQEGPRAEETRPASLDREFVREAATMGLYVTIVLLATLAFLDERAGDDRGRVLTIVWGEAFGLALAHWFAFRVASRLASHGWPDRDAHKLVVAELLGASLAGIAATIPILVLPDTASLDAARISLALLLFAAGFAVARMAGARWLRSLLYGAGVLGVGLAVALIKNTITSH